MADLSGVGGEIVYEEDTKKISIHYAYNIVVITGERSSTPIIGQDIVIDDDEEDIPLSQNIQN